MTKEIRTNTAGLQSAIAIARDYKAQFAPKAVRSYSTLTRTYFYNVRIPKELAPELDKIEIDYASCLYSISAFIQMGFNMKLTPMNKYGFCGATISIANSGTGGGFLALSGEGKNTAKAVFSLIIRAELITNDDGEWLYTEKPEVDDSEYR